MDNLVEEIELILEENNKEAINKIEEILRKYKKEKKPNFKEMKAGDRFSYNKIEWIFLGEEQDGALCITTNPLGQFRFDSNSNDWNKSDLKKLLNTTFLSCLDEEDLLLFSLDLVADDGDDSYGFSEQKVGILSADLWRKYRKLLPDFPGFWWTCSPWTCNAPFVRGVYVEGLASYRYASDVDWVSPICVFSMN